MRINAWPALAAAVLLAVCGCGGDLNPRRPVSGTVTLKGQPLDQGVVQFLNPEGPPGPVGGAMIRDGRFLMPAEHGLPPGTYRVQINSAEAPKTTGKGGAMGGFPVTKERIPPAYNAKSTLTVEVTANKANVFDFDIP